MVYKGKSYQKGWFGGTPILGNPQIWTNEVKFVTVCRRRSLACLFLKLGCQHRHGSKKLAQGWHGLSIFINRSQSLSIFTYLYQSLSIFINLYQCSSCVHPFESNHQSFGFIQILRRPHDIPRPASSAHNVAASFSRPRHHALPNVVILPHLLQVNLLGRNMS